MRDRTVTAGRLSVLRAPALAALATLILAASPALAHARHHRAPSQRLPVGLTDPAKDAALIVDGETGNVLYSRNAGAIRHPASLTKMMTLYLLFGAMQKGEMNLSTPMPISAHAADQSPVKMHLRPGDTMDVDTAIKAIVVKSANDVAVVIAEAVGGTEDNFAKMMTAKAKALGMRNTVYVNASGLPDERQVTTATDLADLARHLAYDYPQYFHYFSTPGFTWRGRYYSTHDNLIGSYQGADGMKTGYTEASGFNLVSSVVRSGEHIIGVVMGGRTAHRRDEEMVRLLDATFARIQQDPTLVARANLPWQEIAAGPKPNPVVAGFQLASAGRAQSPAAAAAPQSTYDPNDEDAAENAPDDAIADDDSVDNSDNLITPQARPKPQTPTVLASYHPQAPTVAQPVSRASALGDDGDMLAKLATNAADKLGIRNWTIQIGAFANVDVARAQLAAYAERSMDVLGQAEQIVVPFQAVDGQTLYRARFGPFGEREAREVCQRLTERGQTCFAATGAGS